MDGRDRAVLRSAAGMRFREAVGDRTRKWKSHVRGRKSHPGEVDADIIRSADAAHRREDISPTRHRWRQRGGRYIRQDYDVQVCRWPDSWKAQGRPDRDGQWSRFVE